MYHNTQAKFNFKFDHIFLSGVMALDLLEKKILRFLIKYF